MKMAYPSSGSEIAVEYGGVTVSGGYGKNTTVFGNLYVNQSVYDATNASGDAISGRLTCNGVSIKPEDDNEIFVERSIGVYQSRCQGYKE